MKGPGERVRAAAGRRVLRAIARTGAALCAPAAVVGLILIAIADRHGIPIESLTGEIGLVMFIFGLIGPFGFWSVHLAVEQWVDEAGEFYGGEYTRPVTIAATVAFGLLALGIFTFALMPLLAFAPNDGGDFIWTLAWLMGAALCLSVFVAAVAGGAALFGWLGAVVGAFTGAGFCLLVGGSVLGAVPYLAPIGGALLVLGVVLFRGMRGLAWMAGREI